MTVCLVILAILDTLALGFIMQRIFIMAFTLTDIENAVTAQNTVIDSVGVLLNQLTEELTDANNSGDQDAVTRIIGEIQANTARLTTAVTANTPGGVAVVTPVAPVAADQAPLSTAADSVPHEDIATQTPAPDAAPDAAVGTPPASATTLSPQANTPADGDPAPEATPAGKGNFSNL